MNPAQKTPLSLSKKFVIQAVSFKDYSSLRKLALKYPLLNLPAEEKLLKEKIELSQNSFNEILPKEKRNFLFVLKTLEGDIIGSSQISSKSGTKSKPSYSLKIHKNNKSPFLCLKKITDGPSYLGGLILNMHYRGHPEKAGKQLSLIRFLFAGVFPHFFENTFHAEVAPFLDKQGQNQFFEQFIKKHSSLSMSEIDYLTLTNKEKLFAHYPKGEIALSSLPKEVQKSIGKPGVFSGRALALLEKQHFRFVDEVDPFDGGPYMQAKATNIPIIQQIKKVSLKPTHDDISQKWLFALPNKNNFKGGVLKGTLKNQELFVSPKAFLAFQIEQNAKLFISPFH